jgi:hypothetical protein
MIRGITGHKKDRNPLTEVEITQGNNPQQYETLTDKESIERAIIKQNQQHARQSLQTPLQATKPSHNQLTQSSHLIR